MANRVKAPLVIVKDEAGADQYLYQGATLPSYVKGDDLKRLKDEDLVETVKAETANDSGGSLPEDAPNKSASKADWVDYATDEARGDQRLTEEQADELTRDQLVERYSS